MTYQKREVVTYPTVAVVAAALKAVELSNGEIVKYDQAGYTDKDGKVNAAIISTRDAMTELLKTPEVLDIAAANEAINFVHGAATMAVVLNKPVSDFTKKMLEKVQNETVTSSDIGFMVYFVPVYNNFKKSADLREKTVEFCGSQFFGKVGEKVEFTLTVISTKWIDKFGLWTTFGHTEDGNLVTFFSAKENCKDSGKYTGKVKKHEQSTWHENASVTTVNYVKRISK